MLPAAMFFGGVLAAGGAFYAVGGTQSIVRLVRRLVSRQAAVRPPPNVVEKTSFANFSKAFTPHMDLSLNVLFDRGIVKGVVDYHVERSGEHAAAPLVLDTNALAIKSVHAVSSKGVQGAAVPYELGEAHKVYGRALTIHVDATTPRVRVEFETTDKCSALQFLTPAQTASKMQPFLFSQSQAIHARTFFPCQDAPAVKMTYTAVVRCPPELTAVMSATPTSSKPGEFTFEQKTPVCAYLVALVVGELQSKDISPRCRVWAQPAVVDAARHEFEDTEKYLRTAEDLCGPYRWGRYDMVVLPSSFPYGGMENPQMTTLTPSLLAGDKSLADVVVHEIMHSWSGNLATNATWSDFWMNEGFTVFAERRVIKKLYGQERADLHRFLGIRELAVDVGRQPAEFTRLHIPMDGIDPDDSFSKVPYEKGAAFVEYLESLVGGEQVFEPFLKRYFDRFAFTCVSNTDFEAFFRSAFPHVAVPDWDVWVNGTGMPPSPPPTSALAARAETCAEQWFKTRRVPEACENVDQWSTPERMLLLDKLAEKAPVPQAVLTSVQQAWSLDDVRNAEVRMRWLRLLLTGEAPVPAKAKTMTVDFLTTYGRMKYVRPLYRALAAVDPGLAKSTFAANRSTLHSIAEKMVERDLRGV